MPFTTNSVDDPNSRYVQGGTTDVYPNRLGWWERQVFTPQPDDTTVYLDPKYNTRPDLMAYDLYGKAVYAWILLQYNSIVDINTEFVTGAQITYPTSARVYASIITNQTGGNVVTDTSS